jgi:hypothetical protein
MRDKEDISQLRQFWIDYGKYCQKRRQSFKEVAPRMSPAEALKLLKQRGASQASSKPPKAPRQ